MENAIHPQELAGQTLNSRDEGDRREKKRRGAPHVDEKKRRSGYFHLPHLHFDSPLESRPNGHEKKGSVPSNLSTAEHHRRQSDLSSSQSSATQKTLGNVTSTQQDFGSNVDHSHPHEHGLQSLLHSPIITKRKIFHRRPHLPNIHLHTKESRLPSVTKALERLELDDTSIRCILEDMRNHPLSREVQERGCAKLTTLAKNRENMKIITHSGGISVILSSLKRHSEDDELCTQAFSALGNLAALDSSNKKEIGADDGCSTILLCMAAHSSNAQLLERACGLIFNLSFDHQNKAAIAHNGGVELIVQAMNDFPDESGLQHNACCALWNLGGSVANKERICKASGVHAIVRGMDTHRSHKKLQRSALGALRTLSMDHECKATIAEKGVTSVFNAMRNHSGDKHVQKEACGTLRNLLSGMTHNHNHTRATIETIRSNRPHQELELAAECFPLECEDNAFFCLDRIDMPSETTPKSGI